MNLFLKIWKQENAEDEGHFETYTINNVSPDSSFLEMLDQLNGELLEQKKEPVTFDHDCREGICGTCSLTINGYPHGKNDSTTTCQLHMREFEDGDSITIEPFRAKAFPVVKDLMVDRSAFDEIIRAGGYVSVRAGSAPDGNSLPIQKETADIAMDALLALDVVRVLHLAKTHQQCCLHLPNLHILILFHKDKQKKINAQLVW